MALVLLISFIPEIASLTHLRSQVLTGDTTTAWRLLGVALLYTLVLDISSNIEAFGLKSKLAYKAAIYVTSKKFGNILQTLSIFVIYSLIGIFLIFLALPFIKLELKLSDIVIALFTAVLVYIEYRRYTRETSFPMLRIEEASFRGKSLHVALKGVNASDWGYEMSIDMFVPEYGVVKKGAISLKEPPDNGRTVIIGGTGKIEGKAVFILLDDKAEKIFGKEKKVPVVFEISMKRSDGKKKWIPKPTLIETGKPKVESMVG